MNDWQQQTSCWAPPPSSGAGLVIRECTELTVFSPARFGRPHCRTPPMCLAVICGVRPLTTQVFVRSHPAPEKVEVEPDAVHGTKRSSDQPTTPCPNPMSHRSGQRCGSTQHLHGVSVSWNGAVNVPSCRAVPLVVSPIGCVHALGAARLPDDCSDARVAITDSSSADFSCNSITKRSISC